MELDITSSTSIENESRDTATSPTNNDNNNSTNNNSSSSNSNNNDTGTILKTPPKAKNPHYNYRQNHVTTVMLAGVPIVCLHIDGKERLCLAQISNTLLKHFSYNEIHNRRVALGITCVQCTPVQLEILRRAGAMPISSRRCGMITNREAERLVKSFLEDNKPPKLPEHFYFEVQHNCGWGCRGKFEPSRYNSSRAKCIKCTLCNLYFSPNKFIFHFHRTPESKYNHPDAANFNSWRRHLTLIPGCDSEDTAHAWEDVKAMFNGGSRKRTLSSPAFPETRCPPSSSEIKKPKLQLENNVLSKPNFGNQYPNYPMFTMPGKSYPFGHIGAPNPLALTYPMNKTHIHDENKQQAMQVNPWRSHSDFIIPPYDLLWANQFNIRSNGIAGMRPTYFAANSPAKELVVSENDRNSASDGGNSSEDEESMSALNVPIENLPVHNNNNTNRLSAFKPFYKSSISEMKDMDDDEEESDNNDDDKNTDIDNEEVDVGIDNEYIDEDKGDRELDLSVKDRLYSPDTSDSHTDSATIAKMPEEGAETLERKDVLVDDSVEKQQEMEPRGDSELAEASENEDEAGSPEKDINSNRTAIARVPDDLSHLSKDELEVVLREEMNIRKQVENDINKIKENLHVQVNREKSQRDEIATQLQAMKDALCNELEQERKIRFSMQQKLKEAHDALHNFSCKMLASRQCAECAFKEAAAAIPR